jgi:hypothetical protein
VYLDPKEPCVLLITYTISADTLITARQIAESRAHADGFRSAQVFTVRQTGPREYEADVLVTK